MKNSIGLFYQITVTDKKGKVVKKTRLHRSKSFVLQFLQLLQAQLSQANVLLVKDNTNTDRTVGPGSTNLRMDGIIGLVTFGTVLGIGTTAPTNIDYVMETLIADGSGAGQINYAAQTFITSQVVGANVDLQAIRSMQNLSGGTINVTEAGINVYAGTWYFLIVHDTFTAVPVADGETITVTYTFRTTV